MIVLLHKNYFSLYESRWYSKLAFVLKCSWHSSQVTEHAWFRRPPAQEQAHMTLRGLNHMTPPMKNKWVTPGAQAVVTH